MVAPEIVACIARGGGPSETELKRVTAQIRRELEIALGTGFRQPEPDQVVTNAIHLARAALEGAP